MLVKKSELKFLIGLWMLLVLFLIPTQGQESKDPGEQPNSDSLSVFGDGQNDSDYEALVKELYGSEAKPELAVKQDQPGAKPDRKRGAPRGPAPGMFTNSRVNGSYLSFSVASPFAVSGPLESWYSYIDAGVSIKLPYEVYVEIIPLYFLFEVSTFSFENTFPQGGTFAGMAYIVEASAIGDQANAALGFGSWDANLGSTLELGYRFRPTKNTFFRVSTRGVLITNIDLIGSAWWAELRLSMGFEL